MDLRFGTWILRSLYGAGSLGTVAREIQRSLTLREKHRLRVLRRLFGPKKDEETGGWRKLHNEELHNLYSPPSTISQEG
jgi:hypothetical protein